MRPFLIAVVFAGMLAGCATASKEAKSGFTGHYSMIKGGFNESLNVEFSQDGSYVLDHELFACVIGPNGELPITYSKETGIWKLDGGVIVLEPKTRTKDFPDASVFAPALARRLVPKRDGMSYLLVSADYPEHFVLKKTKIPIPLFSNVMSPADTKDSPSPGVARR